MTIGNGNNPWYSVIPDNAILNSPLEILKRDGIKIFAELNVTGNNNSYNINLLKLTGTVRVSSQLCIITEITNLTNMNAVHSDLWDGTLSNPITQNGVDLSGLPVGSYFTKDRDSAEIFSVISAATGKVHEIGIGDDIGLPFTVTQKNGVDTFIRFNYTTNTILNFVMQLYFTWHPINGGSIELV